MLELYLQNDTDQKDIPDAAQIQTWLNAALAVAAPAQPQQTHISIAIIDTEAMSALNQTYRHKSGPTNVLSFPDEAIPGEISDSLGDIAICADVVAAEAQSQHTPLQAHWAHMVIHGYLHLLGHDHIDDKDAVLMEGLEIEILKSLGFCNPYEV